MKKSLIFLFTIIFSALIIESCKEEKQHWNREQSETIKSLKAVEGTDSKLYTIDYTADYKLDELIGKKEKNFATYMSSFPEFLVPDTKNTLNIFDLNYGFGCTSVAAKNTDGNYIFARNYDFDGHKSSVIIRTAPTGKYKSVGIADADFIKINKTSLAGKDRKKYEERLLFLPYLTMDGVNEKGLCCSIMALEYTDDKAERTPTDDRNFMFANLVVRYLLDNCATVTEAKGVFENMNVLPLMYGVNLPIPGQKIFPFHFLVADKDGNSAVFEFYDAEFKYIQKEQSKSYQSCANLYIDTTAAAKQTELGQTGSSTAERLQKIDDFMSGKTSITNDDAMDILEQVKQGSTAWSAVYNLNTMSCTVCENENYHKDEQGKKHGYTFSIEKI